MPEKYNWFFLSLRPGDGLEDYATNELLDWFKKQSTSLYIVREKSGSAGHWHICLCYKDEIERSNFQSLYQKTLIRLWNFNKKQLEINTTGKALQIMYNMDVINSYLSGNYVGEFKDKTKDDFEILYNKIDDDDYHKIKDIVPTNNKRLRKEKAIDKILNYVKEKDFKIISTNSIHTLFYELYLDDIISVPHNKFQEETYKMMIFHALTERKLIKKVFKLKDIEKDWIYIKDLILE